MLDEVSGHDVPGVVAVPDAGGADPAVLPIGLRRAEPASVWLTYAEAAVYCRWSVAYLRNLVSAGEIPVYGKPRVRRFRRDMLDLFLTDPDAAMRRFRAERNRHGG
jgi:excisionase family DNA binding protein